MKPGPANQSYGLQVAALAGVPRQVIARARRYLAALETARDSDGSTQVALDFSVPDDEPEALSPGEQALLDSMASVDCDNLTPREALETLYRLKALLQRDQD